MPTDRRQNRFPLPFSRGYPHGRIDVGYDDDLCKYLDALAVEAPQYGPIEERPEADEPFAPLVWIVPDAGEGDPETYVNTGAAWRRTDAGSIDLSTKADVGHDHSGGTLGTDAEPVTSAHIGSGNVDELSVTTQMVVPSVPTANDLPADADSVDTQVMFVEDEQRYYRFEAEA